MRTSTEFGSSHRHFGTRRICYSEKSEGLWDFFVETGWYECPEGVYIYCTEANDTEDMSRQPHNYLKLPAWLEMA